VIWVFGKSEYFCREGWTRGIGRISRLPDGQISRWAVCIKTGQKF
jgi:hypothetical protein